MVLGAAIDALTDVVLVLDDDDTVTWRRRSPSRVLPMDGPKDVVGTPILERIHPDDLPAVLEALTRLRSGEDAELSLSCRIYDASDPTVLHDQDVRAFDFRDVPGVRGLLVAASVQDTRRAFPDHAHGDDFSLAEAAPVGLAILAPTGRIVFANQALRTQLGLAQRTALTATIVAGLHELIAEAREAGAAQRTLTHRSLTLRASARTFGDSGNLVISTDDITAEVEAGAARARSEHTWRAMFDHTPGGIALVGIDGRFLEVNPGWTTITGYEPHELIGRSFADITHPDDLDADQAHVDALLRGERHSYRMEKRYLHCDGHEVRVDLWVSLVRNGGDRPLHFVSQILDLDETGGR